MAILIAHGLRYVLAKWYDLFPDNPYARISAIFPIGLLLGIMIIGGISHFLFGYRYVPMVADKFNNDVRLIHEELPRGSTIYVLDDEIAYNFYAIMEQRGSYHVANTLPDTTELPQKFATLGQQDNIPGEIERIITSPKSHNSDRIYVYTTIQNEEEL